MNKPLNFEQMTSPQLFFEENQGSGQFLETCFSLPFAGPTANQTTPLPDLEDGPDNVSKGRPLRAPEEGLHREVPPAVAAELP